MKKFTNKGNDLQRLENIKNILEDKKAESVEIIDMKKSEYFVDYVVLATTMGERHALSLLDELKNKLKPEEEFLNVDEGESWIVIDLGDVMIHLLNEEARAKYNIEEFLSSLR